MPLECICAHLELQEQTEAAEEEMKHISNTTRYPEIYIIRLTHANPILVSMFNAPLPVTNPSWVSSYFP